MPEKLLIHYQATPSGQYPWLALDAANQVIQGPGCESLAHIATLAKQRQLIVLLPTSEILLTETQVPDNNLTRLRKAIPYALEDQLAADVEQLHFALAPLGKAKSQQVAVIAKQAMDDCLTQLRQAGCHPEVFLADALTLPLKPNSWSIYLLDDYALVRTDAYQGFATEIANLATLLQTALQTQQPEALEIYGASATPDFLQTKTFEQIPINLQHSQDFLSLASQQLNLSFNLLQNKYRVKARGDNSKRYWRLAAIASLSAIALSIAGNIVHYWQLRNTQQQLTAKINKVYYQVFPTAKQVINPKLRIQRKLQSLQTGQTDQGLLLLLAKSGEVLQSMPAIKIEQLTFQQQQLNMQVQAKDFQHLEKLAQALSQQGLQIKQSNAKRNDHAVTAEFFIREKTA